MKNLLLIFISWTALFSCSSDDYPPLPDFPDPIVEDDSDLDGPDPIDSIPIYSKMTILSKYVDNPSVTNSKAVISFDEEGKVIFSQGINYTNGEESLLEYQYNESGRLTETRRNGEVVSYVEWDGDEGSVYNYIGFKMKKVRYVRSYLKEHTQWFSNGDSVIQVYIYDENRNVKYSKTKGASAKSTYNNYNLNAINPFYLLRSLEPGIVKSGYRPDVPFKNVYESVTVPGYMADDYYMPETEYKYYIEYDSQGRVFSIRYDLTPDLLYEFLYEE